MPTFFRTNELTQEQKANWDGAIEKYKKVMRINALRELSRMTEKAKTELMALGANPMTQFTDEDVLNNIMKFSMIMGNPPGHEKSSLFFRLLSGQRVLKIAPPTCYSYPDYGIVESTEDREIAIMDSFDTKDLVRNKDKYIPYKNILINQTAWKVLEVVSSTKIKVTYGQWESLGFVWELELLDIPASESQSAIICHHNPENGKITTYDVLVKEAAYKAEEHFRLLKIVQDENEQKKYEEEMAQKYHGVMESWGKNFIQQTLSNGKAMLAKRLEQGLPNYPTQEEVQELTKSYIEGLLGDDYYEKNGLLYKKNWVLKRVSPTELIDAHYISEEEFNAMVFPDEKETA